MYHVCDFQYNQCTAHTQKLDKDKNFHPKLTQACISFILIRHARKCFTHPDTVSCIRIKAYSYFMLSHALFTHPDSSFVHENQGIFMFFVQQYLIYSPRQQFLARESRHIHVSCPAVPYLHTDSSFLHENQGIFMFLVQQCLINTPRQQFLA